MEVSVEMLLGVTALVIVTRWQRGQLFSNGPADFAMFVAFMGAWIYLISRRNAVGHQDPRQSIPFRLGKALNRIRRGRNRRSPPPRSDDFPSLFG